MDLLKPVDWIPVRENGTGPMQWISYQTLLCEEGTWQISLPRDDLEMACLQMLISLTQVIFPPKDIASLRQRLKEPMPEEEFANGISAFNGWFDLEHTETPFMQTRETGAKKITPIQKLFPGLPEGNNHAFFNEPGEIKHVCSGCAATALFNQNSNSPNFSGKHKGGLRGGAPITTLVFDSSLRKMVWSNVICQEVLDQEMGMHENGLPVWIEPIKPGEKIPYSKIGISRGLFWMPILVRLLAEDETTDCDVCGKKTEKPYTGFWLGSDFKFEVKGVWPHPHSPMNTTVNKGELVQKFSSFTMTVPAWTKLTEFMIPKNVVDADAAGHRPALAITQYNKIVPGGISLLIGGYRNKQASILERRHELHSISGEWLEDSANLEKIINLGLGVKELLRKKLAYASMGNKEKGIPGLGIPVQKQGVELFFRESESVMYESLRHMNRKARKEEEKRITEELNTICTNIFYRLTEPYRQKPEYLPIIALAKRSMEYQLRDLQQGSSDNAG